MNTLKCPHCQTVQEGGVQFEQDSVVLFAPPPQPPKDSEGTEWHTEKCDHCQLSFRFSVSVKFEFDTTIDPLTAN